MYSLLILLSSALLSLACLEFLPLPFVWISLVSSLAFGCIAIIETRELIRLLCINLAVLSVVLGIGELYLALTTTDSRQLEEQFISQDGSADSPRVKHEVLGYAPRKDTRWIAVKSYKDELIYEAHYTIDAQGLRAIPGPGLRDDNQKCILFFGGSFTFGEGLNDNETLPYYLGTKLPIEHQIFNFAFSGYGPHQALAALESNHVSNIIDCKPTHALLLTMAGHVPRSAGMESWDRSGPRYRLTQGGEVLRADHFDDVRIGHVDGNRDPTREPPNPVDLLIHRFRDLDSSSVVSGLDKSFLFRSVSTYILNRRKYRDENVALCIAIVGEIKEVLESRYNSDIEFHVIFFDHTWDKTAISVGEDFLRGLHAAGIEVHMVKEILPDWRSGADTATYQIGPYDVHPNEAANSLLADYVANHLIR